MKIRFLLSGIVLQAALLSTAQVKETPVKNLVYNGQQLSFSDTTSLWHAFRKGQFQGRFRYSFMSTRNEKDLIDFYSNAIGAGVRFETARFHNFQFAISEFTTFNIGSSDLTKPDSLTGQYSRYEIGHFDMNRPGDKIGLARLEELYLKYSFKCSYIKAGRQYVNSTFINLQDGRMSPTAVAGVWAEINEIKKATFQLGWLWGILPRGTTSWFGPGSSIGIYPVGVNANGTKSGYANHLESKGIGIIQVAADLAKQLKVQVSNLYVANIFNTSLLQVTYSHLQKNESMSFASLQVVKQFALNNGGNANQSQTYFPKGGSALSFGVRVGWKNSRWETTLNYNRITSEGRYLVPREWGNEPFFTFLPRERNEGFGDADALMARVTYASAKSRLKVSLASGYYHLPDVKNFLLNKYGMPSYAQLNADIKYIFKSSFSGLEAQFLVVCKLNHGETYNSKKYIFNKVNMGLFNVILNYYF